MILVAVLGWVILALVVWVASEEKPRVPDGTMMGGTDGELFKVFAPRRWQVWRWLRWWRAKQRGVVNVTMQDGDKTTVLPLRVIRCLDILPRVPSKWTQVLDGTEDETSGIHRSPYIH